MTAKIPSASATRILLAKFVPDMESVFALDLRGIATNTGEYERGVNAEVCRGYRDGIASMEGSVIRKRKLLSKITLLLAIAALSVITTRAVIAAVHAPTMPAAEALKLLLDGNQRFVAGKLEHPNQTPERRAEVAKGQHPFAAVLACSDSRTPPEIIFDRGLGDIFTVRVAGNVADKVVIESLDYSIKHLGVRVVMVLGHRRCGAVIAAVEGHEGTAEQDVGPMLSELRPAVAASKGMAGDPVENAVRENVKLVMKNLATSEELSAMVKSGDLKIVGGIYDLDTGTIEMLKD
jgi:carbonic anhydrase